MRLSVRNLLRATVGFVLLLLLSLVSFPAPAAALDERLRDGEAATVAGFNYDDALTVSFRSGEAAARASAPGTDRSEDRRADHRDLVGNYDPPTDRVAPSTGGTTLVADDAVSIRVADRAPVAPGQHNVVLHGDADGFVGATVDDVAAAVRADPAYGGQPVCLLSCNSASNGSAQALATQLDVPVQAPTGLVGVPRPPAVPEVVLGPGSEWVWFYPGGPR